MIAVCASCHDQIHHGELSITDEDLYRWKKIENSAASTSFIYVKPGENTRIILGNVTLIAKEGMTVFHMSDSHNVSFRIRDRDILNLNLDISMPDGTPLVKVVDGHVKFRLSDEIYIRETNGWIQVEVDIADGIVPPWVLEKMRYWEFDSFSGKYVTLLSIRVLDRGLVQLLGIWAFDHKALIATERGLYAAWPEKELPLRINGLTISIQATGNIGTAIGIGDYP